MIYPGKIIIWLALLLPFSAAAPHHPMVRQILWLLIAAIVIIGCLDAWLGNKNITGFDISLPDITRFSIFREDKLKFTVVNNPESTNFLNFKPILPKQLNPELEQTLLELSREEKSSFTWACCPTQRGEFFINTCYIEIPSPLGFWHVRKKIDLGNKCIRVYPNLQQERKQLAGLFLNRENSGLHINRLLGQGREFEKLRKYIPGDSMDIISWKATAKRNKPISKVFQQEQTQDIYAVIDISRLSGKTIDGKTALEFYLTASLALGLIAEKQKDNFGIIAFDSRVQRFIKAKIGKQHYNSCREAIYSLQPMDCSPDYNALFSFIRANVRKRSFLAFLVDLDDSALAESFLADAQLVSKKHVCVVNSLKYNEIIPLFEKGDVKTEPEIYNRLAGHIKWSELQAVRNSLLHLGIKFSLSEFDSFSTETISQYLNIKRRQLL